MIKTVWKISLHIRYIIQLGGQEGQEEGACDEREW